eukprot:SAG11_NODE_5242_length_1619_cov_1.551316_2_plen_119_part_00
MVIWMATVCPHALALGLGRVGIGSPSPLALPASLRIFAVRAARQLLVFHNCVVAQAASSAVAGRRESASDSAAGHCQLDERTLHCGGVVEVGEKWAVNKWVRQFPLRSVERFDYVPPA